jgi:hypothetical protein
VHISQQTIAKLQKNKLVNYTGNVAPACLHLYTSTGSFTLPLLLLRVSGAKYTGVPARGTWSELRPCSLQKRRENNFAMLVC